MTIKERLSEDLKIAMKSGDVVTRSTIRLVLSAVKNEEIEKRKESDDQAVTEVLARMTRQYRESVEMYQNANRNDLVASEQAELAVVMRYLPEQLSQDEVLALVKQAVEDAGAFGPGDRGKVMGRLMPQLRGKADGTMVNTVVTELLESMDS
jgi:uncharacterized protein YqeY